MLWVCSLTAAAQRPTQQWDRTYGGDGHESFWYMIPTRDGGYVLGGSSASDISGDKSEPNRGPSYSSDYWIIKVDAQGNRQWDRTFGGASSESLGCIQQTPDGGYILGGNSTSDISGDKSQPCRDRLRGFNGDFWLVKLDAAGNKQWDQTLGSTEGEQLTSVQLTADGGYLVAGTAGAGASGEKSSPYAGFWVVKLDAQGTLQWERTYAGGKGALTATCLTADGGYLLGGFSLSGTGGNDKSVVGYGSNDFWVLKLDAAGNKQWDHTYGGYGSDLLASLQPTADGGYLLGGASESDVGGDKSQPPRGNTSTYNYDFWIVKVDAGGAKQWDRTYGGAAVDQLRCLQVTADGGYILGGVSTSDVSGDKTQPHHGADPYQWDYWVVKVDAQGTLQWDLTAGGEQDDDLRALLSTPDGGYLLGGQSLSARSAEQNPPSRQSYYWLVKLGPPTVAIQGDTLLCEQGPIPLTATPGATSYAWSTGATTQQIVVTQPGAYRVTAVYPGGYTSTATHQVRAFVPRLTVTGDSLLCAGGRVQLRAEAPGAGAFRWNTGASTSLLEVTQPGTYQVTATYASGCTRTTQVRVQALTLQLVGATQLCAAGSSTLTAVAPHAIAYHWNTGDTTATLMLTRPGTYRVEARFASGCTLTASRLLTLPLVRITGDSLLCSDRPARLTATLPGAVDYHWSTGTRSASLVVTQPGEYSVVVLDSSGCQRTATYRVRMMPPMPVLTLGPDTALCVGQELVLQAPAGIAVGTYRWSDGSAGPTLTVRESGAYAFHVTTPCATYTARRVITYRSCLQVPNVITPNGDGLNDYFAPVGLAAGEWTLTLYSRWGRKVYEAATYHNEWGSEAAAGLYYYLLLHPASGASYKGWVEVIR